MAANELKKEWRENLTNANTSLRPISLICWHGNENWVIIARSPSYCLCRWSAGWLLYSCFNQLVEYRPFSRFCELPRHHALIFIFLPTNKT
jgi:hypothetical protein